MHTAKILLVKATDREDAWARCEEFLEPYGDGNVWDWYSLGNRWNNALAPQEKMEEFDKWVKTQYASVFKELGYAVNDLENSIDRPIIQAKWEEMGLKGKNPYYSGYGFDLDNSAEQDDYNIVPLTDCLETVKKWRIDLKAKQEELWRDMIESRKKSLSGEYDMTGYYAGMYRDANYGNFCFETGVYNITTCEAEAIPEDTSDYWAIVVDLHN